MNLRIPLHRPVPFLFMALGLALAHAAAGCSVGSPDPAGAQPDAGGGGGGGGGGEDGTCVPPFGGPRDPSSLPACCPENGGAHCVPAGEVDPEYHGSLAACDGDGLCVPDTWLLAEREPVLCTSIGGAEGRCTSRCLPAVAEKAELLPQDVCAPDEECVPCISPLDGMPTGACDVELLCAGAGEDPQEPQDPPSPPPSTEPCCGGRGTCVPGEAAGEDADHLTEDSCTGEGELCAPNELIGDDYVAVECESTVGLLGGEPRGACMPDCLADMELFLEDGCGEGYKCVACEVPLLGETGACAYLP